MNARIKEYREEGIKMMIDDIKYMEANGIVDNRYFVHLEPCVSGSSPDPATISQGSSVGRAAL